MSRIQRFEDVEVWAQARTLSSLIYEITSKGDFSRDFGLRDQLRRASVSIMSNIAEGYESQTQALFITYLGRSKASASEVRSQLYLAYDINYIDENEFNTANKRVKQISRSLYNFIKYLRSQPNTNRY